jgi:hypothetical protein
VLVPLSALLRSLGGEVRNAGSVQFAGPCQVQEFMLGHNAGEKEVEEGAIALSEWADDIDPLFPHRLDNSTNVFEAPREAKDHRWYFGFHSPEAPQKVSLAWFPNQPVSP